MGLFLGRRDGCFLLCGRRGGSSKNPGYESHHQESSRREGKAAVCSSAGGRKYKVLGRVGPRACGPVECNQGGADKDEAGLRGTIAENSNEAQSSSRVDGFADTGKSYGASPKDEDYGSGITAPQEDYGNSEDGLGSSFARTGGGGRVGGGSHREGRGECIGFGSPRAEPGPNQFGLTDARRRPAFGFSRARLFNVFKGGPRQRETAKRVECQIRELHAVGSSECPKEDEACKSSPNVFGSGGGDRLFNGELLGTLRRIRQLSRAGNHPVRPQLCDGCSCPRRSCRCAGAPIPSFCGNRTSKSGSGPMGSGFSASSSGRPSVPDVDICKAGEPGFHRQGSSFCPPVSSTLGNGLFSFPEGAGLHLKQKIRGEQEAAAEAGGSSCIPEEEGQVPKRKRRRRRRCDRTRSSKQLFSIGEEDLIFHDEDHCFLPAACGSGDEFAAKADALQPTSSYKAQDAERGGVPSGIHGSGTQLGPVSLFAIVRRILKDVLGARTTFSFYVLRCILSQRGIRAGPTTTALFPIPLPVMDVWSGPRALGVSRRRRLAQHRLLSLVVMALNYVHSPDPWKTFDVLRRRPCSMHLAVFSRLLALIKAGGPSQSFDLLRCGRRSLQLDARLTEILEALQRLGFSEVSKYHVSASGASVPLCNDSDELVPFRPLCADRIRLTGEGNWDCSDYLSDIFYLPFKEPRINMFDISPPVGSFPDVRGTKGEEEFALALVWDAKNLLRLFPEESCPAELSSFCRVFGNRKDESSDRQIGDRRGQNFREGRIPGPSKSLPTMTSLLQLCPRRYSELLVGSITDRRDFYHQFQISDEKASLNCTFPKFKLKDFIKSKAYGKFSEKFLVKKKYDRARRGDLLHGSGAHQQYGDDPTVVACFGAIFQGDHLGVELATDAHVNLLGSAGLLLPHSRLRSDYPIAGDRLVDGLVIDDYFSISREPLSLAGHEGDSLSVSAFKAAKSVYLREGLIGSDGKDVEGALNYKVCGAEIDSSVQSVRRGVVLAGAPLDKRMSLAVLSAAAASLPYTSDALHACLLGSWISILMMRRQVFAVLNESFKVIPQELLDTENPSLWPLPRAAAEEFLLLACLAPVAASNLAVPFPEALYATDASNEKGGIAEASCGEEVLRALWLAADRKGSSVPIEAGFREALSQYDPLHEVLPTQKDGDPKGLRAVEEVDRPLGLCFEFIEICGGSGVVTKELVKRGIICGPVFDLSFSDAYDLCDLRVLRWFIHMLESDRLRSFLVAPPCTSFSPAAFPSVRSYQQPRGYNQLLDKVRLGNILAFMSLCLLYVALKQKKIGVGEQPRRSKMRWLSEWRRLVALGAVQCVVASCAYGSPHQKEFGLIGVNVILDGIARSCPRNHQHIPIQGKYTKPSAIYCPGLAIAFADLFQRHLRDYEAHLEETRLDVDGLESILCNDVCVGLEWKDTASWNWKRQSHINVLEGKAVLRLLSKVAFRGGDVKLPFLCDSHVARSAIAKGRSPSGALRILLKQISSTCVAYGLYPAGVFAPTRFNPADYPSRGDFQRCLSSSTQGFVNDERMEEMDLWMGSTCFAPMPWSFGFSQ